MRFDIIKKIKDSLFLFVPLGCILLWAFITLAKDNFSLTSEGGAADFDVFYNVSKLIFTKPELIYFYGDDPYVYLPFFAVLLWPMGFFTFEQAHYIYFSVLVISAVLIVITVNKILLLKKINNKFHRFLFLIAISNGLVYMNQFDALTGSMLPGFVLILFLEREIKYRVSNKNLTEPKFVFIQMMLLIFVIGVFLQFFFLIIIYLFQNTSNVKDLFKKDQMKRYLFLISAFLIQNFMLIIIFLKRPDFINHFIGATWRGERGGSISKDIYDYSFILKTRFDFQVDGLSSIYYVGFLYFDLSFIEPLIFIISVTIISIITLILTFIKNLEIEKRFGWWALFSLFFYTLIFMRYFVFILPMILILFMDYYNETTKNIVVFIRKNFFMLLGLISIALLYFMPPIHFLLRISPLVWNVPIVLLILRWLFVYSLIFFLLIVLSYKATKLKILNKTPNKS